MEQPKNSGRTIGDTVIEVLSNWKLVAIVSGALLIAFLVVINDAEPGSTVEVFGIKYQRAKPKAVVARPQNSATDSYVLPHGEIIKVDQHSAVPILDGSLAIEPRANLAYFPNDKTSAFLSGASIIGPNISKIKIASRSFDGRPASLNRPYKNDQQAGFSLNSYVEIEYRGKYFSLLSEATAAESMKLTVKPLTEPTLELVPVAQLPEPRD
jgi:hypothetical protein